MKIKNVAVLFYFAMAVLLLLLIGQGKVQKDLIDSAAEADLRERQSEELGQLLTTALNIETGVRGYLLTRDRDYLGPYHQSVAELEEHILKTQKVFDPKGPNAEKLTTLFELLRKRAKISEELISSPLHGEGFTEKINAGKVAMDGIRHIVQSITLEKDAQRQEAIDNNNRTSSIMIWVTVVTSIAIFGFMYIAVREVSLEITKRTKSEHELKINLSYLRTLTSSIPSGILALDKAGKVTFSNLRASELLSFNPDRVQNQFFIQLADIRGQERHTIEKALLSGESLDLETTLGNSSARFPTHLKIVPLHQRSELVGAVVTFQDISREKGLQAELLAEKDNAVSASNAKSAFLSQMSHEFRTPLNAIIGMGEMLLQTPQTPEQMQYTKVLSGAAQNLLRLINDVLDLSKIEAGKLELDEVPFSLGNLLEECMKIMSYKASEKGIRTQLINRLKQDSYFGDSLRLHQVCMNLMGNALKFTEKGQISMEASQDRGMIRIDVSDTGKGIASDKLETIFEKYAQENRGIARNYGGTGLGLSISRDIAQLMGGDLKVTSIPGVGSTFTLLIRLKPHHSPIDNMATKDIHLQPMRLLLVDDNADNRLVVVSYLKGQPVEVVEATDGTEAVEKVMSEKFDLVFMDMHMPIMDGYEATAEIRRRGNTTPIVALTAYALKEEIDRILHVGCMDRLSKPITRARLLNYIAQFQQTVWPLQISEEVIDDDMKALIPEYLARRRQDVRKLQEHLQKKDILALRSIAHNLRGTALSYNQPQLDTWAQAMGKAAHSEDWQEIENLIAQYPALIPKES